MAKTYRLGNFHGTVSLPPKADLRMRMSGIVSVTSDLPPGPEVPEGDIEDSFLFFRNAGFAQAVEIALHVPGMANVFGHARVF